MTAVTPPAPEQAGWRSVWLRCLLRRHWPQEDARYVWLLATFGSFANATAPLVASPSASFLQNVIGVEPEETGQHLARGVIEGWLIPERVAGMYRLSLPVGWQGSWEGYRGAAGLLLVDEAEGDELAS